ncbi:MAG: CocE/NonD family hydrolase [Candidatus Brocadiae bacterium]|nr:CocE/NonD family hydrolase [Candidatus Brocadiia bacterium]
MRWRMRAALAAILAASTCSAAAPKRPPFIELLKRHAIVDQDVMVAMRDGVRLATDVVRPKGDGRYPVVLLRTPYHKSLGPGGMVRRGYAFVAQDVRGRYGSEGDFYPFKHDLDDAFDTIAWIARQPWCDGNVGMMGGSYVGFTQLAAAMTAPPSLRCIAPTVPPSDFDHRTLFYGGALRMELAQGWLLGQAWRSQRVARNEVPADELQRHRQAGEFRQWCRHFPLRDPGPIAVGGPSYVQCWADMVASWGKPGAWKHTSAAQRPEAITVPVLITAGFYDIFAQENIELLLALRQRGGSELTRQHSHLIIGPWVHGVGRAAGDVDFPEAHAALRGLGQKWQARWLKGEKNGVDDWPPIHAFVMGQGRWLATDTWPPKQSKPTRLHLAAGTLALQPPKGGAPSSTFTYDPDDPVPTTGGTNLILPKGIRDHRAIAERPDVLSFATGPLERDVVVVGRLRAHLCVSSSAPDTDFTAMLLDVRPDGTRANVQDGIVRLRYRDGRDKPQPVKPGKVVEVGIDLWSTAYTFKAGHRIALHVSSSNFPRFDRHLNVAGPPADWTKGQKATNTVHHDADHDSYVELPVFR